MSGQQRAYLDGRIDVETLDAIAELAWVAYRRSEESRSIGRYYARAIGAGFVGDYGQWVSYVLEWGARRERDLRELPAK